MEASKDHPTPYPGRVKQRFTVRPSPRGKEDKTSNEITIIPKRESRLPSVSKSVSTLDLSVKDKPARATRRLSIPSKYATPVSKTADKLSLSTPSSTISENKCTSKPDFVVGPLTVENKGRATAKSVSVSFQGPFSRGQGKSNGASKNLLSTPANGVTVEEVSKSGQRKKFSTLMSASYWLAQIKLAESAGKHVISLGFFRLALESTAEPLQRVRDELKSYAKKHSLLDLGEVSREILRNYGILEEVTTEAEAKAGPNDFVTNVSEACPLIPENVEEEESNSGSDCKYSIKKAKDTCSPKVHVVNPASNFSLRVGLTVKSQPDDCYKQGQPVYNPSTSSTYRPIPYTASQCGLVETAVGGNCSNSSSAADTYKYFYWYDDRSNTMGDLTFETFTVNISSSVKPLAVGDVIFGCGHANCALFHGATGLLNLG